MKRDDKIKGVLFGQAIGDALGFGTEGMRKAEVPEFYPQRLTRYDQVILRFDKFREMGWVQGDWTDDTDQTLCILDSLVERGRFDAADIARRLYHWAITDGMGIGWSTYAIIHDPLFQTDPQQAALNYWISKGRSSAPNGGVMRTAILGIWQYQSSRQVEENAATACQLTHADPRCVGSAIAVSIAISMMLRESTDIDGIIFEAREAVAHLHPELGHWFDLAAQPDLSKLELDPENGHGMGYTLRTLAAGFWALKHAPDYETGLLQIIHEGGDADTNAAVAGALMGARWGYSSLPEHWVRGLVYGDKLQDKAEQLIQKLPPRTETINGHHVYPAELSVHWDLGVPDMGPRPLEDLRFTWCK